MGKFFSRLFNNFTLAIICIGFAAVVCFAISGEPYGASLFGGMVTFFTAIYQIVDYLNDWMIARRIKV